MKVKELKEILNQFNDDLDIGGVGDYGEIKDLLDVEIKYKDKFTKKEIEFVALIMFNPSFIDE